MPTTNQGTFDYGNTNPTGNTNPSGLYSYQGALANNYGSGSLYPYAGYNPTAGQSFSQNSYGQQQSTDYTQQQSTANTQNAYGSAFENLNKTYGLTETYGSEIQTAFEQMMSQALSQSQSLNQTSVNDPIGYFDLVMGELAGTTANTEMGYGALQNILAGNTPQFDPVAYQRLQQQAIGDAVARAMSGPEVLGLGETDQDRRAAFASQAVAVPLAQQALEAQQNYDFQNLAASLQAADTLAGSRGDLVQTLLPTLTEYFGSTSAGAESTFNQLMETTSSRLTNETYQKSVAQEIAMALGSENGWDMSQTQSFAESLSNTLATSLGSIFGKAAESGGGKWICSVCVKHGWISPWLLIKELTILQLNPSVFEKARKGYNVWGLKLARWLDDKPKWSRIAAPFAQTFMEYVGGERSLKHKAMFHSVVKFSELFSK